MMTLLLTSRARVVTKVIIIQVYFSRTVRTERNAVFYFFFLKSLNFLCKSRKMIRVTPCVWRNLSPQRRSVKGEAAARAFTHHSRSHTHATWDLNCWDRSPFTAGGSSEPTGAPFRLLTHTHSLSGAFFITQARP